MDVSESKSGAGDHIDASVKPSTNLSDDSLKDAQRDLTVDFAAEVSAEISNLGSSKQASTVNDDLDDKNGWVYVLGHDQLKKRVIKAGVENTHPVKGQTVTIRCVGHLDDGKEVDQHDNLKVVVGDDDFIHAFDLCIALMNKNEVCEIVTESRFAYGEAGREPDVPPNARIAYEVELLDIEDEEYSTLTVHYRLELSNKKRERGNFLYSRGEYSRAVDVYTKAMKIVDNENEPMVESADELESLADMRIKCCNNLAAAQLKLEAWEAAMKSCDTVLLSQPNNVKALFRKGKIWMSPLLKMDSGVQYMEAIVVALCLAGKGNYDDAIVILTKALKIEPETKIVQQELSRLIKINKEQNRSQKELYQKMMGTDKEPFIKQQTTVKAKLAVERRWIWYVVGALASMVIPLMLTFYKFFHDEDTYPDPPSTLVDNMPLLPTNTSVFDS